MNSIKKINFLNSGDEIRIVAPASAVDKDYIRKTASSLENLGYRVSIGKHVFSGWGQFAGTDPERRSDMQDALDDNNVKAIFCARGGYGSVRIVDTLNFDNFRDNPKWMVGFSDITIFHSLINTHYWLPTVHAPMPVNFESISFQQNLQQLDRILKGQSRQINFEKHQLNIEGNCSGILVGGNLSILYSLQSTPYEIDTDDKILFIEDVGEQLYHLDRMLQNFRLSGKLQKIKGLIVGGLTAMKDKKRPFGNTAEGIIRAQVENRNIPVAFNFPAGHIENNIPFVLGAEAWLSVGDQVELKY